MRHCYGANVSQFESGCDPTPLPSSTVQPLFASAFYLLTPAQRSDWVLILSNHDIAPAGRCMRGIVHLIWVFQTLSSDLITLARCGILRVKYKV